MGSEVWSPPYILVLDDDTAFRGLLTAILSARGYKVLEARSAKEADNIVREQPPGLVICDYRLPGTDGAAWITHFRDSGYNTPIVFLSGNWCDSDTFNRLRSLLRVNLILQKPIIPELFLEQIESLLPKSPSAQPAEDWQATDDEASAAIVEATGDEASAAIVEARDSDYIMHQRVHILPNPATGEDLRALFAGESPPAGTGSPVPTPAQPFGRDAMRMSSSGLPAFRPGEVLKPTTKSEAESGLPAPFQTVPLTANIPDEQAIITAKERDPLEQMTRLREKAAVEQALQTARREYATHLPEQVDELAEKIAALKQDCQNAHLKEEAMQIAHRLKGTAGSLGFAHVGKVAGTIEGALLNCTAGDTDAQLNQLHMIEELIRQCLEIAQADATLLLESGATAPKYFGRKVALVGSYDSFKGLSADLSREGIAEAYLIDNIESLIEKPPSEVFSCAIISGEGLGSFSPMEGLEKARATAPFRTAPFCFVASEEWQFDELDASLWLYVGADIILPQHASLYQQKQAVSELIRLNDADLPRVLTVDDDAVLTTFICNTLTGHGIAARALNEPIKVLELLEEYNPDLVLLDVVMPGVSGYDVARMLRAHHKYAKIPILFLTSKSSPEGRAAAFKAGGDDFLSKPILTEELLARVRSRLELSSVYRSRAEVNRNTGMTTREVFERSFNELLARSTKDSKELVVVIIAIDAFQELAIREGFAAQESLFKDLAGLLRSRFRVEDIKGHWTEGSFAIAFPGTEADVVQGAIQCLAGEYAVGTGHDSTSSTGSRNLAHKRRLCFGIGELITDGLTADSLLTSAYERCLHSQSVDVSKFIELAAEGGA